VSLSPGRETILKGVDREEKKPNNKEREKLAKTKPSPSKTAEWEGRGKRKGHKGMAGTKAGGTKCASSVGQQLEVTCKNTCGTGQKKRPADRAPDGVLRTQSMWRKSLRGNNAMQRKKDHGIK